MRERWWGASGRRVPEISLEGDPAVPLDEAVVLDDVADVARLRDAHERGQPVAVRTETAEQILAALARPEVATAIVPADKPELLELDLTALTYG